MHVLLLCEATMAIWLVVLRISHGQFWFVDHLAIRTVIVTMEVSCTGTCMTSNVFDDTGALAKWKFVRGCLGWIHPEDRLHGGLEGGRIN